MKKLLHLGVVLFAMLLLGACEKEDIQPNDEPNHTPITSTVTLIGDEEITVRLGDEFIDPGVKVNGQKSTDVTIDSTLDLNTIGEYTITYTSADSYVMRTVCVVESVLDEYLSIIEDMNNETSFHVDIDTNIEFLIMNSFTQYNITQSRDTYDTITYATESTDILDDGVDPLTLDVYYEYFDDTGMNDVFIDFIDHYLYVEQELRLSTFTRGTLLDLSKTNEVEVYYDDTKTLYVVELDYEGYEYLFLDSSNLLVGYMAAPTDTKLRVNVSVVDGKVLEVEFDLTGVITNSYQQEHDFQMYRYAFTYDFSNQGEVEEITIPEDAIIQKRLTVPSYEGSGIETDPYLIYDIIDLVMIESDMSASYKLMNDIDLGAYNWVALGDEEKQEFIGTFDGNGHKLTNLTITDYDGFGHYGLFYKIGGGEVATVKNLVLEDVNIYVSSMGGMLRVGALGSVTNYGIIDNVSVDGVMYIVMDTTDTSSYMQVGGLIGFAANDSVIRNSSSSVSIQVTENLTYGSTMVGGLVGTGSEYLDACIFNGVVVINGDSE